MITWIIRELLGRQIKVLVRKRRSLKGKIRVLKREIRVLERNICQVLEELQGRVGEENIRILESKVGI